MTITAVWPISSPSDPNAGDGLSITEPAEVEELIARLSEKGAGAATLWHEGRELADTATGMLDHDVVVAVNGGFGYMSYLDGDHDFAVVEGDPSSPPMNSEDADFPQGSGVEPAVLAAALREFLSTGQRPTSVSWQLVDE
jgi:hypothetical protein